MNLGMVRDVMQIMEQGYGDRSVEHLDRTVASKIIGYFQEKGFLYPDEVALLVDAAGGEIRVSEELIAGDVPRLLRWQDELTRDIVFKTREPVKIVDVSEAKVNPDAEVRSGPIKVKPTKEARNANTGSSS